MRAKGMAVVVGLCGFACAHVSGGHERPALSAGKYAVESIRSRATLDGVDQLIEISEQGTQITDGNGAAHTLTERGALMLGENGTCRLALAVSVDGEEPGVSDRACTWKLEGEQFLLGDQSGGGTRTVYEVKHVGAKLVLEGVTDVDDAGKVVGDAHGERIVLVEGVPALAERAPVDRTSQEQAAVREIADQIHDL